MAEINLSATCIARRERRLVTSTMNFSNYSINLQVEQRETTENDKLITHEADDDESHFFIARRIIHFLQGAIKEKL